MKFLMQVSFVIKKVFGVNPGKTLFHAVLDKASISTIRVAISGGGPLAAGVFKIYNELGIDFIQGYGLTETSPIIALNPKEHFKIESVGQFFAPYMEMMILNPDENGIGEVCVKGPMVMQGYYEMPEETAAVFTPDGWFKTGDLGKLDSENYLYLAGRAKNLIVTEGGKNVYPEEIENAFQLYTDIEQITVQGYIMDRKTKSEGIEALVYPSDDLLKSLNILRGDLHYAEGVLPSIGEIVERVNKLLQPYAKISKITILDEPLEMTTTKKVKRKYA
jgi:long-chain acyl-CoA synthetase